jgi:hypothetical protein
MSIKLVLVYVLALALGAVYLTRTGTEAVTSSANALHTQEQALMYQL